jgi:hypothetical protein
VGAAGEAAGERHPIEHAPAWHGVKLGQPDWAADSRSLAFDNLRDFLRAAEPFTMDGRAELIRCPTLLTFAENDPLGAGAQTFFDALRCPKELIRFTAAEGAGDHCEMNNRSLLNRRALDWLDTVLK